MLDDCNHSSIEAVTKGAKAPDIFYLLKLYHKGAVMVQILLVVLATLVLGLAIKVARLEKEIKELKK
ncbi:hypothetical protein [Campylobacter hyointestinalis]|uniref:hypothetical protein n=1 Tax=Campylobacter hyointestinalis TaxID=198 RepID=UPI000A48E6D0|nr:hypothetical protein [Campylobacter hyointestinalis]